MLMLDLFAGIGGGSYSAHKLGIQTTQFVEIDPDAQSVLKSHFPSIPLHSDIRDYRARRGEFDIIWNSFPCTQTSVAGSKTGINGEHSKLWFEALRIIRECNPTFIIIENPTGLLDRGMGTVLQGLSESGYDAEWNTISAAALGAPHRRERVFIVAYPNSIQWNGQEPICWADQVREVVQRQRAISRFPMFESRNDGTVARFPTGLDAVPIGIPRGSNGRIRSRYLFGRTVVPGCAAIALQRVIYLNSCIERQA